MDDYSPFAFRGRTVRFRRVGRPRQYRIFLASCASTIRLAGDQYLTEELLVARIQAAAHQWAVAD
jgi:hypothetical protein